MNKIYVYLVFVTVSTSCATSINYVGTSYKATEKIDVFVDESAIEKNYVIVGKGYVRSTMYTKPETVQNKAIIKAKEKGADAILIKDYYIPASAPGMNIAIGTDSTGKGSFSVGNSMVPSSHSSDLLVLFLKYK